MSQSSASLWVAAWSLAQREVVRFLRQRSRVMGAIGQPIVFWVLFGAGLSGNFQFGGESGVGYQEYFLPGVAVMVVLFTSIFSAISVIQDRNEGFLQGVLVAPVSRTAIVIGKILGGTLLAMFEAVIFIGLAIIMQMVGLAPAMDLGLTPLTAIGAIAFLILISLGMTGLGYLFAWRIDSVQGYHGVMSVVLLPMWLLSGAIFPASDSVWMQWLMAVNPLTYGVAGLRHMLSSPSVDLSQLPSLPLCWIVSLAFCAVCVAIGVWQTRTSRG